jgi:cytidylate kinase
VFLDGRDVEAELHSDADDQYVSAVSSDPPLRHRVNDLVRKLAEGRNCITEGRDMTTVVFPRAEFRFYLDASVEERAKRRFEQKGPDGKPVSSLSLEEIKAGIAARDASDAHKEEGSLKLGEGVHYFNTTGLTLFEVLCKIEMFIRE